MTKLHAVVVRMPADLHRAVKEKAAAEGRSMGQAIRSALQLYVEGDGDKPCLHAWWTIPGKTTSGPEADDLGGWTYNLSLSSDPAFCSRCGRA